MQSRLAATANRSCWAVSSIAHKRVPLWIRGASSTGRTADPAVHSEDPEEIGAEEAAKDAGVRQKEEEKWSKGVEGNNQPSKPAPLVSSPKVESSPVSLPIHLFTQQKRRYQVASRATIENVSCVGVDGTPSEMEGDEEDDKAYFKYHKPSPPSEIEFVDTRKPITRVTDGDADGGDVVGWKEEQLDTAEEALMRAIRIWRESAMRGDPDSPQSRVLRALRGEQIV